MRVDLLIAVKGYELIAVITEHDKPSPSPSSERLANELRLLLFKAGRSTVARTTQASLSLPLVWNTEWVSHRCQVKRGCDPGGMFIPNARPLGAPKMAASKGNRPTQLTDTRVFWRTIQLLVWESPFTTGKGRRNEKERDFNSFS